MILCFLRDRLNRTFWLLIKGPIGKSSGLQVIINVADNAIENRELESTIMITSSLNKTVYPHRSVLVGLGT